jgi:S1-C subfamily serine protease
VTAAAADDQAHDLGVIRTTVQLRNGNRRGSGTVIASAPDETWILTAAHVIDKASDLQVELHRVNFGSRLTGLTEGGGWPRLVKATVAASDVDADVALVLIRGMTALRFVARVDPAAGEPSRGDVLSSVGIDRGLHLTRWQTSVEGSAMVDLHRGKGPRRFTVTSRAPEHGRSGGGLFRADGTVVGVCTGQVQPPKGQKVGVFVAMESILRLLRDNGLERLARPTAPPP